MNDYIIDKIKNVSSVYPNLDACRCDSLNITYKNLWDKISYYGDLLTKQGTEPVIVYGDNSIHNLISILSCIKAKRTYIPIGSCMAFNRLKEIIELTEAGLILSNENILIDDCKCLSLDELSYYSNSDIKTNKNEIAYIIFTSGSTGSPKGVPISYDNLYNFINWISNFEVLSKYKSMNVMNTASFSFDLSVADIFYSLCNGHTLCILQDKDNISTIYDYLKKEKINIIVATPTLIKLLLLDELFNESTFADLKCIYFCGERLDVRVVKELLNRFTNLKVINAYGPTEATSAVSAIVIDKNMLNYDILPVGKLNTCASSIIIENDEIVIKGDSVFDGYLNNASLKVYKENNENVFRTGDIGYIENDLIYCKGRNDNQIKYKGYRIELDDIEINLLKIKGINNAAVVPKYNDDGMVKSIKAFVTIENDLKEIDIKKELSTLIPGYMMPKIKVLECFPINKNGKIDRKELAKL